LSERDQPITESRDQSSMSALAHGQSLGQRFTLVRPLGKGAMGEVWLVQDHELEENVVIKLLSPNAPQEQVALLKRECRNARRLVHPNIVRIHDFHHQNGYRFISMAYISGEDIGRLRGRSLKEILETVLPVADALGYAHREGVIHRDLKTSNVLIDWTGRPHVVDFGIAGILGSSADAHFLAGSGSRSSMSPQQIAGHPPMPSDDIYAFGALLYELLSDRVHRLPEELSSLIAGLLSEDSSQRPESMETVQVALKESQAGLVVSSSAAHQVVAISPPPRVEKIEAETPSALPTRDASALAGGIGWLTIATFAFLLVAAVMVFFFLPGWVPKPAREQSLTIEAMDSPGSSTPAPPVDLRQQAELKTRVEELRQRALDHRNDLEDKRVAEWGGATYHAALQSLGTGDEALRARDYPEAAEAYQKALTDLEALSHQALAILREALAEGNDALEAGHSPRAIAAFQIAAAIEPGNRAAGTGLARASVLNEVLRLLAEGAEQERSGDMSRARETYRRAVSLDGESQTARRALARAEGRLTEDAFRAAMSEGLAALTRRDYSAAREFFMKAGAIRPGVPQVAEGLAQAEEGLRLEAIALHRERARELEKQEEWHQAAAQYEAVLELDATIRFAQEGKVRSRERADLSDRLDYHIGHPERFADQRVLADASSLLDTASEIAPAGPRLQAQRGRLAELLTQAATPVRVVLESDGLTEVTVYKVGPLGRFDRHVLELRPGIYTGVGSRPGYRDVRHELRIEAGTEPPPLMIRCEEEI